MRCAEYQARDRCHAGCPNAAAEEQIYSVILGREEAANPDGRPARKYTDQRRIGQRGADRSVNGRACTCGHTQRVHSKLDGRCLASNCLCGDEGHSLRVAARNVRGSTVGEVLRGPPY